MALTYIEKRRELERRLNEARKIFKKLWKAYGMVGASPLMEGCVRALVDELYHAHLGCATTEELIDELKARSDLKYATIGISQKDLRMDLTIQNYFHCTSAESWSTEVEGSKRNMYTVRFDKTHHKNTNVEYDYSCTCEAYRYREGYCKHIKQVIADHTRCGWMQFVDGGAPKSIRGHLVCPKCGDEVIVQGWAV